MFNSLNNKKTMIKVTTEERDVPVFEPSYIKEQYIVYECSDGKKFTNEKDHLPRYKKGRVLAEEYEEELRLEGIAKEELKFHSIVNDKHDNEGYERSFCFYYKSDLSEQTKEIVDRLIYTDFKKYFDKMEDGWYLVEQSVYEVETSGMSCDYSCKGYFGLLSKLIESKEKDLEYYKGLAALVCY